VSFPDIDSEPPTHSTKESLSHSFHSSPVSILHSSLLPKFPHTLFACLQFPDCLCIRNTLSTISEAPLAPSNCLHPKGAAAITQPICDGPDALSLLYKQHHSLGLHSAPSARGQQHSAWFVCAASHSSKAQDRQRPPHLPRS